jgi:hypothetical protein
MGNSPLINTIVSVTPPTTFTTFLQALGPLLTLEQWGVMFTYNMLQRAGFSEQWL